MSYDTDEPAPTFVEVCALIRQDSRTVEEIGLTSGVDRVTILRWLYGNTRGPNINKVDRVARTLGFSLKLSPLGDNERMRPKQAEPIWIWPP